MWDHKESEVQIPVTDMITIKLDKVTIHLKEPHDLSFLKKYGEVFCVFDQNDSGNISFGAVNGDKKVFIKYAGAKPIHFGGEPLKAIERLQSAMAAYSELKHPTLIESMEHYPTENGYVAVFEWAEGECLHAHWEFEKHPKYAHPQSPSYKFKKLPIEKRLASLKDIFSFHAFVASKGYVAIDFYDGSILYDFKADRTTICDIDFYQRAPIINTMGRMWGSSRFMSPEEYKLGAILDEITNVYALGAMAFEALGDNPGRCLNQWEGSQELYSVAKKAVSPERDKRHQSIAELIHEWDSALLQGQ